MRARAVMMTLMIVALAVSALAAPSPDRTKTFVPSLTVPGAGTIIGEEIGVPAGTISLTARASFTYGSGGTTLKAYVQTSFDNGTTWVDVMCFAFATSTATAVNSVRVTTAVAANYTPTDGSLADNTIKDGLLGDRVRVKYVIAGTYATTTFKLTGVFN